jgi:hypothetical protein
MRSMIEPRKPLRQRVAERKAAEAAGKKAAKKKPAAIPDVPGPEASEKPAPVLRWRKRLALLGNILQAVSLLLLVIEVFSVLGGKPAHIELIALYSVIFIIGRATRTGADLMRRSRR